MILANGAELDGVVAPLVCRVHGPGNTAPDIVKGSRRAHNRVARRPKPAASLIDLQVRNEVVRPPHLGGLEAVDGGDRGGATDGAGASAKDVDDPSRARRKRLAQGHLIIRPLVVVLRFAARPVEAGTLPILQNASRTVEEAILLVGGPVAAHVIPIDILRYRSNAEEVLNLRARHSGTFGRG